MAKKTILILGIMTALVFGLSPAEPQPPSSAPLVVSGLVLGRTEFRGNANISSQYLAECLNSRPGDRLDSLLNRSDLVSISLAYARNGYPHAAVTMASFWMERDSIHRAILIDEGPRVTISDIRFYGNKTTKPGVAARLAGLSLPQPFDSRRVDASLSRLERSGLFQMVYPPYLELSDKGQGYEVLAIGVSERPYHSIQGVLGYQQPQGEGRGWLAGALRLALSNIAGTARSFELRWQRPRRENSRLEMAYAEPFVLGFPLGAQIEATHRVEDSTFVQTTTGLVFSLALGDNVTIGWGAGLERVVPGPALAVLRSLKYSARWQISSEFEGRSRKDRRALVAAKLDYGRKRYQDTGAQHTVARIQIDGQATSKLWKSFDAFCGMHGRAVASGERPVPRPEQYAMGGAASLRGYYEDEFMADQVAWGRLELRWSADRMLSAHPFWDVGYFWDGSRGLEGIRQGYGFGFRLASKIGRIEIDYGLGRNDGLLDGKVHLLVGSDF